MSEITFWKKYNQGWINKSSLLNSLDFITAGTLPPNPSELIISDKFDQSYIRKT
jgi:hypothetical protein